MIGIFEAVNARDIIVLKQPIPCCKCGMLSAPDKKAIPAVGTFEYGGHLGNVSINVLSLLYRPHALAHYHWLLEA